MVLHNLEGLEILQMKEYDGIKYNSNNEQILRTGSLSRDGIQISILSNSVNQMHPRIDKPWSEGDQLI